MRKKIYSVLKSSTASDIARGHSGRYLSICDGLDTVPAILDESGADLCHYVSWITANTDLWVDKVTQDCENDGIGT